MFGVFEKLAHPYPDAEPMRPPQGLLAFLWHCTDGVRRYIAAMALCSAASGAFDALLFNMLGSIVDQLANISPERLWIDARGQLLVLAGIMLASPLLVGLGALLRWQTIGSNMPMRLRWLFHRLMLGQSSSFYANEFAGRVSAKVMQTAMAVRDIAFVMADALVFVSVTFVTMVVLAGALNTWLLLPFLVYISLYVLALSFFVPRMTKVSQEQSDAHSMLTGRITDAYANMTTIKLFSHSRREANYAKVAMQEYLQTAYGQSRLITASDVLLHTLNMLLILAVAGLAMHLWTQDQLGVGAVAAATAMAIRVNSFSHWMLWEMAALFEHVGTVQDGINTLARPNLLRDQEDAAPLRVTRGDLRFEQVCFSYGGTRRVIDQLSLHIRAGEKIGLVGRSGAGKSSIVNILLRTYDIESGRVLIDGQNIAHITQDSLRAQIGLVTQDSSLLHRSVRDNIVYGRPDASEADMIAAAKRAAAHDFILSLVDGEGRSGYDAHVGERGVKLSGGQRQRIAIARVMLKNAPILVLDEATSALDSEVEASIQTSLAQLMEGKTVLAIAHRLSTIAAMDRLLVIDRGEILEQGDHPTLLARGGLYASMWSRQSGGFLGEEGDDDSRPISSGFKPDFGA